ncbi:uncharacterized protein LOC127866487 [Dreissena polymorpha]|uniref:Uncharacterized protein n=1 Tax=Dreissena polymorpha TaxID=45954 RepID=A0A9D4RCE4_DREPO|nr:uncharacterized protein LOC127866487 [Dreissena polymorpha]KAH3863251.1 hypothetical protein DPMN_026231 [Dreissena polymorpha]
MAATRAQKLDLKHGFMKSIVKNQVDRDNYDKEVKESKQNKKGFYLHNAQKSPKKPDAAVYIPPPRKEDWDNEVPPTELCNGKMCQRIHTQDVNITQNHLTNSHENPSSKQDVHITPNHSTTSHENSSSLQAVQSPSNHSNTSHKKPSSQQLHNTSPLQQPTKTTVQSHRQGTNVSQAIAQQQTQSQYSDDDDEPKLLFIFEFEDKDGKRYKQYVIEGVSAAVVSQRMGYDRRLPANMIRALERWLQDEIDKRTKPKS